MVKLTILCMAISEMGHMNATIGVAIALKNRGHRVVFATERSFKGKVSKFGLQEELFDERETVEEVSGKYWAEHTSKLEEIVSQLKPEETMGIIETFFSKTIDATEVINPQLQEIIKNVKPDVIVEDFGVPLPAFIESNVPVIKLYSVSPLFLFSNDPRLPPLTCGLPLNDKSDWERCRPIVQEKLEKLLKRLSDWMERLCPQLPKLSAKKLYKSTNLNIYMYPKLLIQDYLKLCPLSDEWIGVDHCLRKPFGDFEVPQKLKDRLGKLILFSLGSMGSAFAALMKRLIAMLEKSRHKFIVSLGYRSDEYELGSNMWGEQIIPQLSVLPHVDLVLTHGGNNSFIETVYFGKPMIVLPLFGDQFDNAQRAVEMNIGLRFNPFTVGETELNEAIESLLCDANVTKNVKEISKTIQESDSMDKVVEKIENIAKHPKLPTYM